ncbi:MAG: hypothetical protein ACI9UT_003220 [Flavobacteriales bacterium]|jgi:hypothetical protein
MNNNDYNRGHAILRYFFVVNTIFILFLKLKFDFFSGINVALGFLCRFQLVVNLVQVSLIHRVAKSICGIQDYFFGVLYS